MTTPGGPSDDMDGGNLLMTTDPVVTTSSYVSPHKVLDWRREYIYDYYNDVDIIKAIVCFVSLVLILIAVVFWCAIWCNARFGHPYRCATFITALVCLFVYHLIGLISTVVYVPQPIVCQLLVALRSYADITAYTIFFFYVILCIGIAVRRLESGAKFYSLVAVALVLPLVLVVATTCLRVFLHPEKQCDLLDELGDHMWYDRAPKCFLLFGTICILAILFYWLFCFDNALFKLNRDFLLIRHSSVTVMLLVNYCFFLELYEIVFLSHGPDGNVHSPGVARWGLVLTIFMSAKGAVAACLLCFFDLEIFNLIHNFSCCPDINNTIVDQSWEKRIRSESKVKFFEDSSDENQAQASGGVKEKSRVLPQLGPKYGTLTSDGDEK